MNSHLFLSVVIPTHDHAWEIDKVLFSLEKQVGIQHSEYEIIVVNTLPEDKETLETVKKYQERHKNLRLLQVYDKKALLIKNATYPMNLGVKNAAKGPLLLLVVDSARIPTPGVLRKTRDEFERWGNDLVATTIPYHIGKHYSDPSFTPEECRAILSRTRWEVDVYHLFSVAAHTNISKTGIINESTYLGVTKENYLKVGGHNENFTSWSQYNLDLWRRLTRDPPKDGIQIPGKTNDHWGKIGLGLKVHVLEGEADFHIHHDLSGAPRSFASLKKQTEEVWRKYEFAQECIIANSQDLDWGTGEFEEYIF